MQELSGVTVVVTRPAHQAENLCQLIGAAGGEALRFPVIEIKPPKDVQKCQAQMAQLEEYDLAIFISSNAVNAAMELMDTAQQWPKTVSIAAVGKSTAQALEKNGLTVKHVAPMPFNTEALLSLPDLQNMKGKRILIFRGNSGRELLLNSLQARGAEVSYMECYQRVIPQTDTTSLYAAWRNMSAKHLPLPIVITSNEGLKNLIAMVDSNFSSDLFSAPLIMISKRTAKLSEELGFTNMPIVSKAANDEAILDALKIWARYK